MSLTLRDRCHLIDHLFFLIGLSWDPSETKTLEEVRQQLGTDSPQERFFLGGPVEDVRELFVAILAKFVGRVVFREPVEAGSLVEVAPGVRHATATYPVPPGQYRVCSAPTLANEVAIEREGVTYFVRMSDLRVSNEGSKKRVEKAKLRYAGYGNGARWQELRELLEEVSEAWDDKLLEKYHVGLSFDEAVHLVTGLRLC